MKTMSFLKPNGMSIEIEPDPMYGEDDLENNRYFIEYDNPLSLEEVEEEVYEFIRGVRLWHTKTQEMIKNAKTIYK